MGGTDGCRCRFVTSRTVVWGGWTVRGTVVWAALGTPSSVAVHFFDGMTPASPSPPPEGGRPDLHPDFWCPL